jgi:hypothetical protein
MRRQPCSHSHSAKAHAPSAPPLMQLWLLRWKSSAGTEPVKGTSCALTASLMQSPALTCLRTRPTELGVHAPGSFWLHMAWKNQATSVVVVCHGERGLYMELCKELVGHYMYDMYNCGQPVVGEHGMCAHHEDCRIAAVAHRLKYGF